MNEKRSGEERGEVRRRGGLEVAQSREHPLCEDNSNPQSHGSKAGFRGPLKVEYCMRQAAYSAAL
jgi:hypothetical protein